MKVTLVETAETLEVCRKQPDGTLKTVGSYGISVSDPAFVRQAEKLVEKAGAPTQENPDYQTLTDEAVSLLQMAFENPECVDEALGGKRDMFNALLLLTAVMQIVNELDPGRFLVEQLNAMLPDEKQLSAEMLASRA